MCKSLNYFPFVATFMFLAGCASPEVVTTWKAPNISFGRFSKIVVVGVVQDTSFALRRQMEAHFVAAFKDIGYNAVAASEEFGPRGLANLHQEETYQKLCGKGIDAVLTIALIDAKKEKQYTPSRAKYYSDLYYYNRIWNYRKIQPDLSAGMIANNEQSHIIWEGILFDLAALQPLYAIQSLPLNAGAIESKAPNYAHEMVSLLLKKKVLARQKQPKSSELKAF